MEQSKSLLYFRNMNSDTGWQQIGDTMSTNQDQNNLMDNRVKNDYMDLDTVVMSMMQLTIHGHPRHHSKALAEVVEAVSLMRKLYSPAQCLDTLNILIEVFNGLVRTSNNRFLTIKMESLSKNSNPSFYSVDDQMFREIADLRGVSEILKTAGYELTLDDKVMYLKILDVRRIAHIALGLIDMKLEITHENELGTTSNLQEKIQEARQICVQLAYERLSTPELASYKPVYLQTSRIHLENIDENMVRMRELIRLSSYHYKQHILATAIDSMIKIFSLVILKSNTRFLSIKLESMYHKPQRHLNNADDVFYHTHCSVVDICDEIFSLAGYQKSFDHKILLIPKIEKSRISRIIQELYDGDTF